MNIDDFKVGMVFENAERTSSTFKRWVRIIDVIKDPVPKILYHASYKSPEGPFITSVTYSCVRLHTFFKGKGVGRFMLIWSPDGNS